MHGDVVYYEGFVKVIINDDYSHINLLIEKITRMRLGAGFMLSDVQMAVELFHSITTPLLANEATIERYTQVLLPDSSASAVRA